LRQLQKTHGGVGVLPYLRPEQRSTLPASEDVTAVTGHSSSSPLFFGRFSRHAFFGQPEKCEGAHTSLPNSPPKVTDLALGGGIEKAGGNVCPTLCVEYRPSS